MINSKTEFNKILKSNGLRRFGCDKGIHIRSHSPMNSVSYSLTDLGRNVMLKVGDEAGLNFKPLKGSEGTIRGAFAEIKGKTVLFVAVIDSTPIDRNGYSTSFVRFHSRDISKKNVEKEKENFHF